MSIGALLWSFEGRINRQPYWLASLATVIALSALVGFVFSSTGVGVFAGDLTGGLGVALLILAASIPFIWIGLALGAKRLHDRNKSAWWLLVFYVLPSVLERAAGYVGGAALVLGLASFAISIWALVELGFLRGTSGANRYGPDPLARV
jgi:uncharacterized membrane protein YhaH (DUF805 family)